MKKNIKIALLGATANPNLGDEAVLEANLDLINEMYHDKAKVYIFTKNASFTSLYTSLKKEYEIEIVPISYLHQITLDAGYDIQKIVKTKDQLFTLQESLSDNLIAQSLTTIFKEVKVLHIIGGGYMNSKWPDMLEEIKIAVGMARKHHVPYLFTGQNIHLYHEKDRQDFKEIFQHAVLADFRDHNNDEWCKAHQIAFQVTTDDAVSLKSYSTDDNNFVKFDPYCNLIFHTWEDNSQLLKDKIKTVILPFIIQQIQTNRLNHFNILGFSEGDLTLWNELECNIPLEVKSRIKKINCITMLPSSVKGIIAGAQYNIGTRFHAAVFSLSSGRPCLSFYSSEYYRAKIASIHEVFHSSSYKSLSVLSSSLINEFIYNLQIIENTLNSSQVKNEIRRLYNKKVNGIMKSYSGSQANAEALYEKVTQVSTKRIYPKISVIIPIYNMGRYLAQCLDSIMNQTLREIEIICINDGSKDNTKEILNQYSWKDKRIKVIEQKNHGVAFSRNQGIKQAQGEFLYFIDPDDWLPDEKVFEDLYRTAIAQDVLICGGAFLENNIERGIISNREGMESKYLFHEEGIVEYKDYQFDYGWVRFIYNRKFIVDNNLLIPDRKFFEDPVFFVKTMSKAQKFYALKRFSYCYRSGHHSYDLSYEKVLDLLSGMKDILEVAIENHYDELISLENYRLTHDYALQIANYLNEEYASELRNQLNAVNILLNRTDYRIEYECMKLQKDIAVNNLQMELNRTYHSFNWRLGKNLLYIPKKIASLLGIKRK